MAAPHSPAVLAHFGARYNGAAARNERDPLQV
jgi:hypothetical protein